MDEEYLTSLTGWMPDNHLFSDGVEYGEEYFESLSDLVGNRDQKCNFCDLIEQLGDVPPLTNSMEEEINQLRIDLVKAKKENENLEVKMKKLEVILKIIQLYFSFLISRMKFTVKQSPPYHLRLLHPLQNQFYPI